MSTSKKFLCSLLLSLLPLVATAEYSCDNGEPDWSDTEPAVNLRHIFCGESHNGRNKGFHSTALINSSKIVSDIFKKKSLRGGVYNARVKFSEGKPKFSTFFPDHCTVADITRSVVYAANHSTGEHPQWGILGESAPRANSMGYCLQNNGEPFTIRMGMIKRNSRVNTAFPQP